MLIGKKLLSVQKMKLGGKQPLFLEMAVPLFTRKKMSAAQEALIRAGCGLTRAVPQSFPPIKISKHIFIQLNANQPTGGCSRSRLFLFSTGFLKTQTPESVIFQG